jgi:hypothetical protein
MSILKSKQLSGSLAVTSSWAVSASYAMNGGGSATLAQQLISNQTIGGNTAGTTYNVGTSLETVLRTMLITYIPPTLTSLTIRNGASTISTADRDVGNSFTFNTASFSATADNPTSIFPLSSSFTASGADVGTITQYFGDNVLSTTNARSVGANYTINRATTDGSVTFTVRGRRSDTLAFITNATTSISFRWRNYLAASATIITNNTTAQTVINTGLVQADLNTGKAWDPICTAANDTLGNYTYIMYPASYGDLTDIKQNGALSVLNAFTKLGDYTITNVYGSSISVRVYKSNSDKAFANAVELNIT